MKKDNSNNLSGDNLTLMQHDSSSPHPFLDKVPEEFPLDEKNSLAVLSAKQMASNVSRIYWQKVPTLQTRTLKRLKNSDISPSKSHHKTDSRLVRKSMSPDGGSRTGDMKTHESSPSRLAIEKLERISKDLENNTKDKDIANPKVLESWVNDTLLEVERADQSIEIMKQNNVPLEKKQPLKRYGLDRANLEGYGMSKDKIDRLYRCLFVYSAGFYEFITEMFQHSPNRFNLVGSVWKVFWILLEYCYKSEHQTIIEEINKENKEQLSRVLEELQRKEKEVNDLENWRETYLANFQKDLELLKLERENLLKEKTQLEEDVKINEKAYSDEVQLRIKFENKINDFYATYHDLKVKNDRILEELMTQHKKTEELVKDNSELRGKLKTAEGRIIDLEELLSKANEKVKSTEAQVQELTKNNKALEKKYLETLKANQSIELSRMQAELQNSNFKLETSTTLNKMLQGDLNKFKDLLETKSKEIQHLEEKYSTLEKAYEEKTKEILDIQREKIEHEDRATILQDKINDYMGKLEAKTQEYDDLFKENSRLKHRMGAELEKAEALEEERNKAEETMNVLNKVRNDKEEDIRMLQRMLEDEKKKTQDSKEKLEQIMNENAKLDSMMLEQREIIHTLEEKMKEAEEHVKSLKIEIHNNEEYANRLIDKEKADFKVWISKSDKDQEKIMEVQLENINLKQTVEAETKERRKQHVYIEELERTIQSEIMVKTQVMVQLQLLLDQRNRSRQEFAAEKDSWEIVRKELEKKVEELTKKLEENNKPVEKHYHPMVVEDLLARIQESTLKLKDMDSRHYKDFTKLTEANYKLKEAKKVHARLYALADRLLKDKGKMQEEIANQAFLATKAKNRADLLQKREEGLLMEIAELKTEIDVLTKKNNLLGLSLQDYQQKLRESLEALAKSQSLKEKEEVEKQERAKSREDQPKLSPEKLKSYRAAQEFLEGTDYVKREILNTSKQSWRSGHSHTSPDRKKEELSSEKLATEFKAEGPGSVNSMAIVESSTPVLKHQSSLRYPAAKPKALEESSSSSSSSSDSSEDSDGQKTSKRKKKKEEKKRQQEEQDKPKEGKKPSLQKGHSGSPDFTQTRVSFHLPEQEKDFKSSNKEIIFIQEQTERSNRSHASQRSHKEMEEAKKASMNALGPTAYDALAEIDAFFSQQLSVDQILMLATNQACGGFRGSPTSSNMASNTRASASKLIENLQVISLRDNMPLTTGSPLTLLTGSPIPTTTPKHDTHKPTRDPSSPGLFALKDKSRSGAKSILNTSGNTSSQILSEKGEFKSPSIDNSKGDFRNRTASQPYNTDKTTNKLKQITGNPRPITPQKTGALTIQPKKVPSRAGASSPNNENSQASYLDDLNISKTEVIGYSRNVVGLPPLPNHPQAVYAAQRSGTGELVNIEEQPVTKPQNHKRYYSVNNVVNNMVPQRLEPLNNQTLPDTIQTQQTKIVNATSIPVRIKKRDSIPDLNKSTDAAYEHIENTRIKNTPERHYRRPSLRAPQEFQVISELDSLKSSPMSSSRQDHSKKKSPSISAQKGSVQHVQQRQEQRREVRQEDEKEGAREEGEFEDDVERHLNEETRAMIDEFLSRQGEGDEIFRPNVELQGLIDKIKSSSNSQRRSSSNNIKSPPSMDVVKAPYNKTKEKPTNPPVKKHKN